MDIITHLLLRSRTWIILGVVTGIVSGLGSAALIGLINTEVHAISADAGYVPWLFAGLGFLVLSTHVISTIIIMRAGQTAARDLRMELSRRIMSAPLRLLQQLGTPRLMANFTEDIGVLVDAFQIIPHMCINISWVLGCLIYLGWLSWNLFILVVTVITLGILAHRLISVRAINPLRLAREQDDALYAHFRGLIQGIKEIKLHRRRSDAFLMDVLYPTAEACRRENVAAMTLFILAAALGTAFLYFLIGVILFEAIQWQGITLEIITGYTLTVLYMMSPLTSIVSDLPTLGRASVALDKIDGLKRELAEQLENTNACMSAKETLINSASEMKREVHGTQQLRYINKIGEDASTAQRSDSLVQPINQCFPKASAHPGLLEFIGVTHRYKREGDERDFTLGPLNLVLQPGELVFITGGNGSGKSTFGLLLVGLYYPEAGQIRLNGEVIDDANRENYRQQFSVVFSDFYLFDSLLGLMEENLDSKARTYLTRLQLDHKVSIEGGVLSTLELSQGQRKRLALVTAYLEDRPFYVFDEWAADQDPIFKEIFYTAILADLKARGKTVVVITHDDHYYHLADRCIRIESGQIMENPPTRSEWMHAHRSEIDEVSVQKISRY